MNAGEALVDACLAATPRELTDKLPRLERHLLDIDGIAYIRINNGNAGYRHKFY